MLILITKIIINIYTIRVFIIIIILR